ncbi:MAG: type IV secretory system conjugative DNA transfer family protein [Gammaproteobacteria bacterium]|jgi:type IV secretion system protein VirD4|nr:type IV secretory system conjugative DNA transfer family protein [Gammaproteobacteria bacterium]
MSESAERLESSPSDTPLQPILGWSAASQADPGFGFQPRTETTSKPGGEAIADAGEGHLMTIAPTGAGKGRSAVVPTLLSYDGPVIVIDPKGENFQVTARRRSEMGQRVFLIDPFCVTGESGHSFNTLDTLDPKAPDAHDQALAYAELVAPGRAVHDPFWEESARSLIAVLSLHVAAVRPPVLRNFSEVVYLLNQSVGDMAFTFKEMQKSKLDLVRRMANGWCDVEPKVLSSILAVAKTATAVFNSDAFGMMSGHNDIPLDGIVRGDPISIYLVLPPEKLDSHGPLLRLWIGCLMDQICQRRHQVEKATLFMLDEAAQLGTLQQLRRAVTLLRGYGVRTWSFWQDLSQLQTLYADWETLYNNTRYIQAFGIGTHLLANKVAGLLNLPGDIDPLRLDADKLILAEAGRSARVATKPDYLNDPCFEGLYDDNAFYQPAAACTPPKKVLDTEDELRRLLEGPGRTD